MFNAKVIGARIATASINTKVWLLVPKKNLREMYEFKRTYKRLNVMFNPTEDFYFPWGRDERGTIEHVLVSFAAQSDLALLVISVLTGEWFSTWEEVEEDIEYWNERIPIDSES